MSLDVFNEISAVFVPQPTAEDLKLAEALAEDAATQVEEARRQRKFAERAHALVDETASDESRRELVRIAVWHYERCAIGFRRAVVSFGSAARIQKNENLRRRLLGKAETSGELAMRAELAVLELKDGEKKMKGGSDNETG